MENTALPQQALPEIKNMYTSRNTATHQTMSTLTPRVGALAISLALFLGGCAMNETQKRTGGGAAIGALGGALLGTSRESAAIGAAV